jgi:hypothetical protein
LVRFPAGRLLLEGELVYPEREPPSAGVVVAGPHPLLGGTMDNNVVAALTHGLAGHGLAVLRFNYRGTGDSDGLPVEAAVNLAEFWATSHVRDERSYRLDLVSAFLGHVPRPRRADLPP